MTDNDQRALELLKQHIDMHVALIALRNRTRKEESELDGLFLVKSNEPHILAQRRALIFEIEQLRNEESKMVDQFGRTYDLLVAWREGKDILAAKLSQE